MARYAIVAFLVYFTLLMLAQQVIARLKGARNLPAQKRVPSYWLTLASRLLLLVWMVTLPLALRAMRHQPVYRDPMVIGAAIVLLGLFLSGWAQWALGRNWVGGVGSIGLHRDHQYVRKGPYRRIRHPMYSGMILSSIGLGLFAWNVWFFLSMMCFAVAFGMRSYGEDKLLAGKFTKAYPKHVREAGRFLPRVRQRS